jgi:hypothetical protein
MPAGFANINDFTLFLSAVCMFRTLLRMPVQKVHIHSMFLKKLPFSATGICKVACLLTLSTAGQVALAQNVPISYHH